MKRLYAMTTALAGLAIAHGAFASPVSPPNAPTVVTAPVNLGAAFHFVLLSQSGITDVASSTVVGSVGTSPITGAADLLSCSEVTGNIYSVDAAGPAPCSIKSPARLSNAIGAMHAAYTDAASRTATTTEWGAGEIGGLTFPPGVYSWSSNVDIPSDIYLDGKGHDVWIFQVAQNVNLANGVSVHLLGLAKSKNIFWQVAGAVTLGTTSHMEGIVLSKTMISAATGAEIHGRLYAQTAVTLQQTTLVLPRGELPL
jgi:Ice-binding-like